MEVFNKHIKDYTVGTHQLLVLDSHNSHVSPKFDRFYLNHQIVVLYIPAHSSHLLQPLDVGCFSVLKQLYGHLVKQIISRSVNYINKHEFLPLYRQARQAVLHQNNIQAGFAATGLVLYSPDRVLAQLYTEYQTPSPQCPQLDIPWAAETPHNVAELQQQMALLRRYLKQRTYSPPSPTEQALSQLIKGYEIAILSTVLLINKNKKLRVENQRQKRKRVKRRTYIAKGGVLSVTEGASRVQAAQEGAVEGAVEAAAKRLQRAVRKCSIYKLIEHNAHTCPRRQLTSQQITTPNTIICG